MAGQLPTPVPLSENSELERQYRVSTALLQLLDSKDANARDGNVELEALLAETEALRCVIHLADLDKCRSQRRKVGVHYAIEHDDSLSDREEELLNASESERQRFYNDIFAKLQRGDFSSFSFEAVDYQSHWAQQRARRLAATQEALDRLTELEALTGPQLQQQLTDCGNIVGAHNWSQLPRAELSVRMDALTMGRPDDLWVVAEAMCSASQDMQTSPGRDLMLVVDLSGSMCDVLPLLQECLHETLARATTHDRVCVVGFSCTPKVLCDWTELQTVDARRVARSCVEAMAAHGGTKLVPALECAGKLLAERDGILRNRPTIVVLLSDGDPDEPAEAISSVACRAFDHLPNVSTVALALGEESRPDLMALLAQAGGGASLYISGEERLPGQLGRMWGLLGAGEDAQTSRGASIAETFLILEPAEGAEILEAERPPGGSVVLAGEDGRQIVALRCGRLTPGAGRRVAARLRLPSWLTAPVEDAALQRPLLRATWLQRQGGSVAHAISDVLRVVQVPSLLVEARLGIPLRVVLAAELEDFDRERFLEDLAAALGQPREELALARLSRGSVIADFVCTRGVSGGLGCFGVGLGGVLKANPLLDKLAAAGHVIREAILPGAAALQRTLQWRLAAGLESAARGDAGSLESLRCAQALAVGETSKAFAAHPEVALVAEGVAADAAAALEACSGESALAAAVAHELELEAHAHWQCLCPELAPKATSVRGYELEALRQASQSFEASAAFRAAHAPPAPAALELDTGAEARPGCVAVRVRMPEVESAAAVIAFRICVHSGDRSETTEVPIRAGSATEGVTVNVPAVEEGASHALVAAATNGREWGPDGPVFTCRPAPCVAAQGQRSPSKARRSASRTSLTRRGPCVELLEGSATALGTLDLRWDALRANTLPADWQWVVHLRAWPSGEVVGELTQRGVTQGQAHFSGLPMSTAYRFSIQAQSLGVATPEPRQAQAPPTQGLSIQGVAVARGAAQPQAQALPHGAEGVVVVPPYAPTLLRELKADSRLRACGPGLFLADGGLGVGRAA